MTQPLEILLVEDNPADVYLTLVALEDKTVHHVHVVGDGVEALNRLGLKTLPYRNVWP